MEEGDIIQVVGPVMATKQNEVVVLMRMEGTRGEERRGRGGREGGEGEVLRAISAPCYSTHSSLPLSLPPSLPTFTHDVAR